MANSRANYFIVNSSSVLYNLVAITNLVNIIEGPLAPIIFKRILCIIIQDKASSIFICIRDVTCVPTSLCNTFPIIPFINFGSKILIIMYSM